MAKRGAAAKAPDIVEHDSQELVLARTDGDLVNQFVGNLRAFFGKAGELEATAKLTLSQAEMLRIPKDGDEDAGVQRFIQGANSQRKQVEEHWTVTTVFSRFHKRLTSARARATEPLERAAQIANGLHQRFVDDQRRKEQLEAERLRREAEEKARQDRERELAALEAQAAKAEEASEELSEREDRFVTEYAVSRDGFKAASRAGFAQPRSAAERLLKTPKIQQALTAIEDARRAREQAEALRAAPVHVEESAVAVRSQVQKVGADREYWSGELLDERALVDAVCEGRHGIPRDLLVVSQPKLNEYARSMHELINRWPGCRAKRTTKVL